MRPGVNELVAYARALDYLVGRKAAGRIVVHIGCEVAPVVLAVVEHKQAAHLANIGIEAQDARVLVQHGAVAAGARNHLDAGSAQVKKRLHASNAGISRSVGQHARTGCEHSAVEVGKYIANAGETLLKFAFGHDGQHGGGHWCSILLVG